MFSKTQLSPFSLIPGESGTRMLSGQEKFFVYIPRPPSTPKPIDLHSYLNHSSRNSWPSYNSKDHVTMWSPVYGVTPLSPFSRSAHVQAFVESSDEKMSVASVLKFSGQGGSETSPYCPCAIVSTF